MSDVLCLQRYPSVKAQRILISGTSGLIGSALVSFLQAAGHTVVRLVRSEPTRASDIRWDPATGFIEEEKLELFDAVINLAGDNIAAGRWTRAKKERLRASRLQSTELLVKSLAKQSYPPKLFLCASAIGFYGDRGEELLDEDSSKGTGFLADLCADWEAAARQLPTGRVAMARFGIVLSGQGGALKQMLRPFKLGIGGILGSGKQYYSWISIDDAVYQLYAILMDDRLQGPINLVSPNPVTNYTFTKTLGKVLSRPTILPMPKALVGLLFGEMGDALLLCSSRVIPKRLSALGIPFAYPDLEQCLRHLLDNTQPKAD